MQSLQLLNDQVWSSGIEDELQSLFGGDGTIYLVSGFFTYNAFDRLRADIDAFLSRDLDNKLVVIVSTSADQFSARIVRDLQALERNGQVKILRYRDGFMHAKLYFRDGPEPAVILGSANLTKVAMEQNFELCVAFKPEKPELDDIRTFVEALEERCEPVRPRDLFTPFMVYRTVVNWSNKGKLISPRTMLRHPLRLGLTIIVLASLWLMVV